GHVEATTRRRVVGFRGRGKETGKQASPLAILFHALDESKGRYLWTCSGSVADEGNDAAKQRNKPETEYGHAKQGVNHLLPDFLVRHQLIGYEGKTSRQELRPKPEKAGVPRKNRRLILVAHVKLR